MMLLILLCTMVQMAWAWEGSGTSADPYLIKTSADWKQLADDVSGGNSYSGLFFEMTADIDAQGISVGASDKPFSGTLSGGMHTLTYNRGTMDDANGVQPVDDYCAPFVRLEGATIRHLRVTGAVYSSHMHAAGIASLIDGSQATTISNCHVSSVLFAAKNLSEDASFGGLVGEVLSTCKASPVITGSSFTGKLDGWCTSSGGLVAFTSSQGITFEHCVFDPQNIAYIQGTPATLVRMAPGVESTFKECYYTQVFGTQQGEAVFSGVTTDNDCTYEMVTEPTIDFDGHKYYQNGARIKLTVPEGKAFDHWDTSGSCYISDPWQRDGIMEIRDVKRMPYFRYYDTKLKAKQERTMDGTVYRYLSSDDYHLYLSDELCVQKGYYCDEEHWLVKMVGSTKVYVTAVTGWEPGKIPSDGAQIHNDLAGYFNDHTLTACIAPHAFDGCTELTTLYFKDTDANAYDAATQFDFRIGDYAFANCPNLTEVKLMQYTTKGTNHWEALKPGQVSSIASTVFSGSPQARFSTDASEYQNYLASATWKDYQNRIIVYNHTHTDMTVNGAQYSYMRNTAGEPLKNSAEGNAELMQTLRLWNADYQQFAANSLLTNSSENVWYTTVVGYDDSYLKSNDGVMRIYNDPGSYYNYKTIAIGRNAFKGSQELKVIEFWQTNGRSENSYSDMKLVIQNGAFANCPNLKELRLYYYAQDGDDGWRVLGPKDVIPGDNIFGLTADDEDFDPATASFIPTDFRIVVAPQVFDEFINDPNWVNYVSLIKAAEYAPTTWDAQEVSGLTYDYASKTVNTASTNQMVTQTLSWWNVPIKIYELLTLYETYKSISNLNWRAIKDYNEWKDHYDLIKLHADEVQANHATEAAMGADLAQGNSTYVDDILQFKFNDIAQRGAQSSQELAKRGVVTLETTPPMWTDKAGELLKGSEELRKLLGNAISLFSNNAKANVIAGIQPEVDRLFNILLNSLGTRNSAILNASVSSWLYYMISRAYSAYTATGDDMTNEEFQRGLVESIKANIHNVSYENTLVYTPDKKLIYHVYVKKPATQQKKYTIYHDIGSVYNYRTVAISKDAFQGNTQVEEIEFADTPINGNRTYVPMQLAIPDSAFAGCTGLKRFSLLYKVQPQGDTSIKEYRGLGPENFILGGDSIFAGCDSTTLQIIIPEDRKQDFLNDEMWSKYKRFFKYEPVVEHTYFTEYGVNYSYSYDSNTSRRQTRVNGHAIDFLKAISADNDFLDGHQGSMALFNDIGSYNNYKLDLVKAKAFAGNDHLKTVSFWDLIGGDSYTTLDMTLGDSCFADCKNLKNIDMLYCVTDGDNHLEALKPSQVRAGKGMLDGSPDCIIKMLPQQLEWFKADTAWVKYEDRFRACIIQPGDEGVMKALKNFRYYTPCSNDTWDGYIDLARIAGTGFSALDNLFIRHKNDIRSFAEFEQFEAVGLDFVGKFWFTGLSKLTNILMPQTIKTIRNSAFYNCSALQEMELPAAVSTIEDYAFAECPSLNTIVVRGTVPATLGEGVFTKNAGLKIYVPAASVDAYMTAWAEYRDYIVSDALYKYNKVVTVTKPDELAEKLGLSVEYGYTGLVYGNEPRYVHGNYAKYDSLTVSGPLGNVDLAVIRYLAGCDAYTGGGKATDGRLRYLNLYNATIKKTDDGYNYFNDDLEMSGQRYNIKEDNLLPDYLFNKCTALETVILPKSLTKMEARIFAGCTGLKQLAVTSGLEDYDNWAYTSGLLDYPLATLTFLGDKPAQSSRKDPWEQPISNVYTKQSQLGEYMGQTYLTQQARNMTVPLKDDAAMDALTSKGHFFPEEYLQLESIDGIFSNNKNLSKFEDFYLFRNVRTLGDDAFYDCANMLTITLPDSVRHITRLAFANCNRLATIYISTDSVPVLEHDAFGGLPADFRIFVPKALCKLYRERWAQYADHINADERVYRHTPIQTVTVTAPNTLAEALGLKANRDKTWEMSSKWLHGISGDYSGITRLKVVGPISSTDFDLLRYLAGYCPWRQVRNYMGRLEYLDLYDANIVEDNDYVHIGEGTVAGGPLPIRNDADVLESHSFTKAYSLKTLILPRTCKKVKTRALQECENLETLVIGDDMEDFNWSALDDGASLSRMYILAKKKPEISSEFAVWRWLCNNYNPTFDAFFVRPSLYNDYVSDANYTGSSWQRTNNISKGAFSDDDSFCAFAAHAAATQDDLTGVTDVERWFDAHPGVKDLTPLKYTAVDSLSKATLAPLTQLEQIAMPAGLRAMEEGLFEQNKRLRYVDLLMNHDTELMRRLKEGTHRLLGTNEKNTLVYMPAEYGDVGGTNVIVDTKGKLTASEYYLNDTLDYMVPYAFDALSIVNSRKLPASDVPYTVCLPYSMTLPRGAAATYKLSQRDGNKLVFEEVTDDEDIQAMHPYLIMVYDDEDLQGNAFSLDSKSGAAQTIPASTGIRMEQDDAPGYSVRGTLKTVSNSEAADMGAYILQSDGDWYPVRTSNTKAEILPYRCYLLPSARNAGARISMTLTDADGDATGIDTIETIGRDGTHTYYDLQGRRIDPGNAKGVVIKDGKKIVVK